MFSLVRLFQDFDFHMPELKDVESLKETGEVTEEKETKGDFITRRVHYKSFDGRTEIHREFTTHRNAEKFSEIDRLVRKKNKAIREDNLEEAIKYRDEINRLTKIERLPKKKTKELQEQAETNQQEKSED